MHVQQMLLALVVPLTHRLLGLQHSTPKKFVQLLMRLIQLIGEEQLQIQQVAQMLVQEQCAL